MNVALREGVPQAPNKKTFSPVENQKTGRKRRKDK
jgi:hypothetical protein